jgi:hypothetical protein
MDERRRRKNKTGKKEQSQKNILENQAGNKTRYPGKKDS